MNDQQRIQKILHKSLRESNWQTKKCFIVGCDKKPIKAHSISNSRLLAHISENGEVMYMNTEEGFSSSDILHPTGKGKASTFTGFCDVHDKIFESIDNSDYDQHNVEHHYLFAFRALAREYTVRLAVQHNINKIITLSESSDNSLEYKFDTELLNLFKVGFDNGTEELKELRSIFNINWDRRRFWKLVTETIILDAKYPFVASSTFKLESSPGGRVINDLKDFSHKGKTLFFTLIPQNGQTFCILSWQKKDSSAYRGLEGLNKRSEKEKRIIISNLLTGYVENFAVNPQYWESLPTTIKDKFHTYWGQSMRNSNIIPFIFDNEFSLFI